MIIHFYLESNLRMSGRPKTAQDLFQCQENKTSQGQENKELCKASPRVRLTRNCTRYLPVSGRPATVQALSQGQADQEMHKAFPRVRRTREVW